MTATSETQRSKRSKGFTIDCIMGTDTDSQTDKRAPSPDHSDGEISPVVRSSRGHTSTDREHVRDSESDRFSTHTNERTHEHTHGHSDSDRLQPSELSSLSSKYLPHRTSTSLHSDAIRDINFSSANIREGIRAATSPDALKHFHEAFIQTAGAANGGVGVPLGHFDAQRHFRHPLSTMGVSGYPGHPMTSHAQVHPMLLNGVRDLRHMYPYIADRYPSYLMPRYGMGGVPGLFFQPYRKPKRIRTAFSPSQLLQLEKSFEKSHYVVGQERKDLANELQLSETQVKVWFQNRRTKYKRTKSEHDEGGSSNEGHDTSHCQDSNDESDISDIDDIDDVGDTYNPAHAYHNPIQTC